VILDQQTMEFNLALLMELLQTEVIILHHHIRIMSLELEIQYLMILLNTKEGILDQQLELNLAMLMEPLLIQEVAINNHQRISLELERQYHMNL